MQKIPVVILCGGPGTRMNDTMTKKELIDVGGRPLLWHVLRIFSSFGYNHFVLALGHLGNQVRRYFFEYETMSCDVAMRVGSQIPGDRDGSFKHPLGQFDHDPWEIVFVDAGPPTVRKGSRVGRVSKYLTEDRFFVAYGEAVADIDLNGLVSFHMSHGKLATVTGVQARGQYGVIEADEFCQVSGVEEKPWLPYWINGGFLLMESAVIELMQSSDSISLEQDVLPQLASQNELMLYKHDGYWQSMKTLKDAAALRDAGTNNQAWKVW